MATRNICDVKSCEAIIKDQVFTITICDQLYDFCKTCYEGLMRFIGENLNKGHKTSELQLTGAGMSLPYITTPNYIPNIQGIGYNPIDNIKWITSIESSSSVSAGMADKFTIAKNEK
jgi:hypothetical protein